MRGRAAAVALTALLLAPAVGSAQGRDEVIGRCFTAETCVGPALAAEAILGGVGLGLSGGSELPGSPSTLGRRTGSTPRWAIAARLGLVHFDHPSLGGGSGPSEGGWAPSLQAELALGVFDGLRLKPTVGGFLSVDALLTYGVVFPRGDGFDGSTRAFGYGLRLGILRESFTLPAVTLSATRRHTGSVEYDAGDRGVVIDGATVTSLRASVGKEFLALGILGGLGWERVDGEGSLRVAGDAGADFDSLHADRLVLFGGLTKTWLVLQGTLEGGFASGFDEAPESYDGGFDPTGGSVFLSLSFRLIL